GFEIALVGHFRVAVDSPKILLGLPEVTLGLLPGAGGLTKVTRHLGLLAAQPYVLEGKTFSPAEGKELGLVHALVPAGAESGAALRAAALAWLATGPKAQHPWDDKDYKVPGGTPANPKMASMMSVAPAMLKQKTRGLYPAPQAILSCMVEGLMVDMPTALRIESRYLAKLFVSREARAQITTFFNMNAIKSGQSRPKDVPRYKPKKVGVLGAGMMGAGIAWAQASQGIATVLKDVSIEKAETGKAYSQKLSDERVKKGRMSPYDQKDLLDRIQATGSAADLAGCDLIIEAVFENRDLKASVTQEAEPQLEAGGFFASNTSTLPISGLAKASAKPAKFIGIHFFSPVDKMKLVEIIRGKETDDETVARAYDYVQAIGKVPIVVNDSRGFFTSRVFGTFVNEGTSMLAEGLPAAAIENAGVQCGMPVGPLAVIDETSMSLSVHVMEQTRKDFEAEGKTWAPTPGQVVMQRMVTEFKRPGRAGGGGFYDYPSKEAAKAGAKKTLWNGITQFEKPGQTWNITDMKDRILYRQAVETARCLAEGVLTSVHDANIGSIFGIGFPAWAGGAMQFIYGMGIEAFEKRADELAAKFGDGFKLTPEVRAAIRKFEPVY
ncbi:MAG: 3-hydroxyacyl-CoA dehydrogenase NAD-binding domain-containing protein, partial [Rhodoferax sp.]